MSRYTKADNEIELDTDPALAVENLKVTKEDFMVTLQDIKPSFGFW